MLLLVVLVSIFVGHWLEHILPNNYFTLSSSDSVLPELLTIFEDRMFYHQGNVYKLKQHLS